ncbi:hypothetical protein TNCV_2729621 [Trichonephila clavipes]|nr:hypothetical protein TNCV_2729621 [Trichonephila clavipes]
MVELHDQIEIFVDMASVRVITVASSESDDYAASSGSDDFACCVTTDQKVVFPELSQGFIRECSAEEGWIDAGLLTTTACDSNRNAQKQQRNGERNFFL